MLIFFLILLIIILLGVIFYFAYIKPRQDPLNKALELSNQNKYIEAISEYKKILSNKPDAFEIHFKIANIYAKLENYEQVILHLNEILRIDKYNLHVDKDSVIKKLARAYYYIDDVENAFQKYLDLIKISPEDSEAYYHVAFIALGQEEFDIAQRYFEKLVKLEDNFESFFGAGICSFQNKKNEDANNYFKECLSLKPDSDIGMLAISFSLQRSRKYNEAILYLNKLLQNTKNDDVMFISKRLLYFLNFQAGKIEEGLQTINDLLSLARNKGMLEETKLCLYDIGFAYIKNKQIDKAAIYWEELYQLDNNYKNINEIFNMVKKDLNKNISPDGFETSVYDYIEDWEANAFSANFLWDICGLKSDKIINIKSIITSAKIRGKEAYKQESSDMEKDYENRVDNFKNLDNENFKIISNRLVFKLGYKVNEILHTYRDSDGIDILALSQETDEKILVWIRRWKESMVGEITLRNFAQAINDIKAQKGVFITTVELTKAAQTSLKKLSKIRVIYPEETSELLKGLI